MPSLTKRAVLGFPIQLITRMLNIGGSLGGYIGGAVTVAAAAVSGLQIAQAAVPAISGLLGKDANQSANTLGATSLNPLEALITFMDLNANMLKMGEKRRLSIIDIPGREGDFIQNLGAKSVTYRLTGRFFAVDPKATSQSPFSDIFKVTFDNNVAVGNTQLLRLLMRTGVPAPFMCEYDIAEVIVANLDLQQDGGRPEWINYTIDLIEYRRLPQLMKMFGLSGLGLITG